MESLLSEWDGESVLIRHDKPTGAWMFIAIHSTRLGPAIGGTRMKSYPDASLALKDALSLSAAMTYKYAVSGFPSGGGKAVIFVPSNFDSKVRADLLRRYGAWIKQLGGLFRTGPDIGTSPDDMDIIAETGTPYIFARTPQAGGAGSSGPPTALGVFCGIQATVEYLFGDESLIGRRVLVQGIGGVGGPLIERLLDAGAEVLFSDVNELAVQRFKSQDLKFVKPEDVYDAECDIFSPCALGGILNSNTIPRLRCAGVAGGANNQLLSPDDAARLAARNILYAPDFVVNIGGAMAITGIESFGWSWAQADENVRRVGETLRKVFDLAAKEGITTDAAARQIADENLKK